MESFGKAVKTARIQRGLSQQDLAEQVGIDRGNLSRIENGKGGMPTAMTIHRFQEALNIEMPDFMRLAGATVPPANDANAMDMLQLLRNELDQSLRHTATKPTQSNPTVSLKVSITHPTAQSVGVTVDMGGPIAGFDTLKARYDIGGYADLLEGPPLYALRLLAESLFFALNPSAQEILDEESAIEPDFNRGGVGTP